MPGQNCGPLSDVFFVDGGTDVPTNQQTGSICASFKTISQALLRVQGLPIGSRADIEVTPGTYDENLTIPAQREITIRAIGGTVTVGGILNPGSVTWANGAPITGGSALLQLENVNLNGAITITDTAPGIGATFIYKGRVHMAGVLATGMTGALQLIFSNDAGHQNVVGTINAPTATLEVSGWVNFAANVIVNTYERIDGASFGGNVTVTAVPGSPIAGLFNVTFTAAAPVWTGPAVSFRADGTTLHAALAGPITFSAGLGATVFALDPEPERDWAAKGLRLTAVDDFLFPWFENTDADGTERQFVVTRPGTLRGAYLFVEGPAVGVEPITYTLRVNGADTAVVIASNAGAGGGTDDLHRVNVVRGDVLSVKATHGILAATPTGIRYGVIFD